jgi:3-deoxy-D-manno-octulosonic-acid transferase
MRWQLGLVIYRVALPLLFLAAFPGWLLKMARRGGFGTRLHERLGIYTNTPDFEPCGAVHIHSVSVGETQLALKLIRKWRDLDPAQPFVIATGTATGHTVATAAAIDGVRVTYAPLDFPGSVSRYLRRFEPSSIVLIEAEVWPHLVLACEHHGIPVHLVNARLSPRSARRFIRLAAWVGPMFRRLASVCTQEADDVDVWQQLGLPESRIHYTGSLKFDPAGGGLPTRRDEFATLIEHFGKNRPVILASSTHSGEEPWIASAIREAAPHALPVIVPRHAERRGEVVAALRDASFHPVLRTHPTRDFASDHAVLVIDTTGELRDWTAHADVVIIGKSFLARGGQNPCEAIQAGIPVITGPHMDNFQPLTDHLLNKNAILRADDQASLAAAIRRALDADQSTQMTMRATSLLASHEGATSRIIGCIRDAKNTP